MNIKRTLKRLIDDTQYVAALEKQNDLLKENLQQEKDYLQKQKEDFRKEKEQKIADEEAPVPRNVAATTSALSRICRSGCWRTTSFRYNAHHRCFRIPQEDGTWLRNHRQICHQHHRHRGAGAGIFVRDHFVERLIKWKYAHPYHPIRSYIDQVERYLGWKG